MRYCLLVASIGLFSLPCFARSQSVMVPFSPAALESPAFASQFNGLRNTPTLDVLKTQLNALAGDGNASRQSLNRIDSRTYFFDSHAAANIGIPLFNAEARSSSGIYIQEFLMYRNTFLNAGGRIIPVDQGIGVRLSVTVRTKSGKASPTSLAGISASVEAGDSTAEAMFEVMGINSQTITNLIPTPTKVDLEAFVTLSQKFDQIKQAVWTVVGTQDYEMRVDPAILRIGVDATSLRPGRNNDHHR